MWKPDLKPDDVCSCGSERRYADCHAPIFSAKRGKAIDVAHGIYVREWGMNAEHYAAQGLYTTLAQELAAAGEVSRVLDIGCGLGQGLEALAAVIPAGSGLIVGVDENPACLAEAAKRLGLPTDAVASPRLKSLLGIKLYDAHPSSEPLQVVGDRVLVNADVLIDDAAFHYWLRDVGPFDAISLWFTGGHKARSITKSAQRINAKNDEDFRSAIEDQVMEVALRHLRPGGLIQLVNRANGDPATLRREIEANRRHGIAPYPVALVSVRSYPYAESEEPSAIVLRGPAGAVVEGQQMAISTILQAREVTTASATAGLFKLANRTPFNIAPERAAALATKVFGTGDWTITPHASKAEFWARVDQKAVHLTWAGLASLWCVTYVAFEMAQLGSTASRSPTAKNASATNFGKQWHDLNLQGYVDYAKRLIQADESWPIGLDLPNAAAPGSSVPGRMNNLFFGALSWILLHEIGHVHLDHEPILAADQMVRQEVQADDFATSWMLDEAGAGLDREFRTLMIITALAWLFLFESAGGQGHTHPPVIRRFRAAVAKLDLGDRSPALEHGSYLLKALFDPATEPPSKRQTPRQNFDWVSQRLEELFPAR